MRAAAACTLGLAVLEVATLVGQTAPATYVVVLLLAGAVGTGAAGVALARGGCAVSRTVAGVVAGAVVAVVLLLVTVGRPGGHPMPFTTSSVLALALAGAVLALVSTEAVRRRRGGSTGAKRAEPDNLGHGESRAARGGRPGHRTDARHRAGA
jgi:hypothetical protein